MVHNASPELLDMVLYFNASSRVGRDGLVWAGWNADQWGESDKKRGTSPRAGAHLVMVSTKGARFLMGKRTEIPDMHMGNFLSKKCGMEWQEELGAAYIMPPIGSYAEHESSTSPGQVLMHHFNAKWAQEGTRPFKPADKCRWICGFTQQGPANRLHKEGLNFALEAVRNSYFWLTEPPPSLNPKFSGLQDWHRQRIQEELRSPSPMAFILWGELAAFPPPADPRLVCKHRSSP